MCRHEDVFEHAAVRAAAAHADKVAPVIEDLELARRRHDGQRGRDPARLAAGGTVMDVGHAYAARYCSD